MHADRQSPVTREQVSPPQGACELCARPAVLRVVRWTTPTASEPERLVQQSHWFCDSHEPQAAQMEALLWKAWRRNPPRW
jgi:hypothetical protein